MRLDGHEVTHTGPGPLDGAITVLVVDDESPFLDVVLTAFERDDQFDVETVTSIAGALDALTGVDCVVDVAAPRNGDELELLAALRERMPTLPYVLVAADPQPAVVDQVLSTDAADLLRTLDRPETAALVRRRVALVVSRQRALALARRSTAAIETTREGIAVVTPEGTVQFANRLFAHHLDYDVGDVVGRPWRDFFTGQAVERIETDALPSVAEGWRWVGTCVSRRPDGAAKTVSTAITRLDDDSLVFTLSDDLPGDADASA